MKPAAYDEMLTAAGAVRPHYAEFAAWLAAQPAEALARKRAEADLVFHRLGITFAVYGEAEGTERLIPFDQIPRILPAAERAVPTRDAGAGRTWHFATRFVVTDLRSDDDEEYYQVATYAEALTAPSWPISTGRSECGCRTDGWYRRWRESAAAPARRG